MSRYGMLLDKLKNGESITYKEFGNSMLPTLKSGVMVTVSPCCISDVKIGDVVFCKVRGAFYLHYVKALGQDGQVQIGNAHGHINGWTKNVYGKLVSFENPK
jgi:hypothetical protein